jgi:hypothetical protein
MEITIILPLDDELEVWTLGMSNEEIGELSEKYGHRGTSVLVSPNEVGEEIDSIWREKRPDEELTTRINNALENELRKIYDDLNIKTGDISPLDSLEWDRITNEATALFQKLINFNSK